VPGVARLHLTKVLLQLGLDAGSFGCSSLSGAVLADVFQFDFLLLPSTQQQLSAFVPADVFQISQLQQYSIVMRHAPTTVLPQPN